MSEPKQSATELATELATKNTDTRFAIAENQSAIGIWDEKLNRFVAIIEKAITGHWIYTGGTELPLVKGQRIERNWQEVQIAKAENLSRRS